MNSKLIVDQRLTKAEAAVETARDAIEKMKPTVGEAGPQVQALRHLADGIASILTVLREWESERK